MTRPIIKLMHGSDVLNLMDAAGSGTGRYKVAQDFMPPTAARMVTYGPSDRGSSPVAKQLENIGFSFSVHVKATSLSEAERGRRDLQTFLNRAGGATPLYLAYRSYDDYDFEPHFGMHGAFARYEIVHGVVGPVPSHTHYTANTFLGVPVYLVIRPQAVYKPIPTGQATGGIYEDYIGTTDGRAKGTRIPRTATNKMTNPAFMASAWNTGWTVATGLETKNTDPQYILFGDTSARITANSGVITDYYQSIAAGNTNNHIISFYVKRQDGAAITTDVYAVYGAVAQTTNYVSMGNGWYWCWASVTGVVAAANVGVRFAISIAEYFVDGFQFEENSRPTFFIYGDMLDCSWSGTKNGSTSTRTTARLRYLYNDFLATLSGYTIRVVWTPDITDLTGDRYLLEDSDDETAIWMDSSQRYNFQTSAASSIQSAAVTLTAGTPEILHFTYDGLIPTIYRNGAELKTGTSTIRGAAPTYYYIGSDDTPTNNIQGVINGVATFQREMSATEVTADYREIVKQLSDEQRVDPLPWVWTQDGDNVVDNDNYPGGGLYAHCVVGGLMGDDLDLSYKLDSSQSDGEAILGMTWGALPVEQRNFDKDILDAAGTNTLLFINGTGTADTSANGDDVLRTSLSTSTSSVMATAITKLGARLLREAKSVVGYFVAKDAGTNTNVQVRLQIQFGSNSETFFSSEWRTISTTTSFRPYVTDAISLDFGDLILDSTRQMGFRFQLRRTAGASTQNFDISHAIWLPNFAAVYTGDVGNSAVLDMFYVRDRVVELAASAVNATQTQGRRLLNRALAVRPEYLNVYFLQHTAPYTTNTATSWTTGLNFEIEQFVVTPRFDIY